MSIVTIPYRYGVRGGTAANLATVNEVPLVRELVFETDTGKFKLGDGVTHYNALPYIGASIPADPNADRIIFWDDSAGSLQYLTLDTGLSIAGTLLSYAVPNAAITNAKLANVATKTIKARKTAGTGDPEDCTVSEVLDFVPGTPTKGDLIVRDTSASARIAAGTSGHVLTSNGAGALPTYQAPAAYTDSMARAAVVIDSIADSDTDHAPSRNAVFDALALKAPLTGVGLPFEIALSLSDLTTALTTGTNKGYFRPAFAATGVSVRASLLTVSSSGLVTVDMNLNGTTMMTTNKLTIDASEKTSLTAATAVGMTTTAWAADDEIAFDIDGAGTGAKGLIVTVTGTRA